MLRHPSLIPLSRQHHNGLALGVLGRRDLADDRSDEGVARVAKRVIAYFDVELVNHFQIEEDVLFPACEPVAVVDLLKGEHREIERMIGRLREAPSESLLEEIFKLLTSHIRREERELFEEIQRTVPAGVLERIGPEIERRAAQVCLRG